MLLKILGVLDLFAAVCFWIFSVLHLLPGNFIMILGILIFIKGIIFILGYSVASILDIIAGLAMIIASSIEVPYIVRLFIILFLAQKGIFSLLS